MEELEVQQRIEGEEADGWINIDDVTVRLTDELRVAVGIDEYGVSIR